MRVCPCVHACVRDVFAIYDNDIFPRLIMIIIKLLSYISYKSDTLMISPNGYPSSKSNDNNYKTKCYCELIVFKSV